MDTPTGMFMIPLPYSDDIRELAVPPAPKRTWVGAVPRRAASLATGSLAG